MRPEILNPLFAEVEALKGVGPANAKSLARLGLTRAIDLAFHLPTGTIERIRAPAASSALLGRIVIIAVTPYEVRAGTGRAPTRIFAAYAVGNTITLTFSTIRGGRGSSSRSANRASSAGGSMPMATSGRSSIPR